jgi:hypothetical protein
MKESGRVSLLALGSLVCVVIIVVLLLFSRESPSAAGTRFMVALQDHDVDTLTKLSMMKKANPEDVRKQWDFAMNKAEKYYRFAFKVEGSSQASDTTASVKIRMIKDSDKPGAYDELYELPMVRDNDEWKVDVRGLSRDFFNCLPR